MPSARFDNQLAAGFGDFKPGMADADVAKELVAGLNAAGDLPQDDYRRVG